MIAVGSEGQRSALSVLLDHLYSFFFVGGATQSLTDPGTHQFS